MCNTVSPITCEHCSSTPSSYYPFAFDWVIIVLCGMFVDLDFSLQTSWWALCKRHLVLFRLVCERKSVVFTVFWSEMLNLHLLKHLLSFPATTPVIATFPVGAIRVVPVMCKLVNSQNYRAVWVGRDLSDWSPCYGQGWHPLDQSSIQSGPSHQLVWISFQGSVLFHETSESQIKCLI